MVQDEIKRRKNSSVGKSNLYSSQYALTGIVFCGECGANYRRVTWARDGKKKIVWRCMERLENGIRNCKNSPTINEDKFKDAISNDLNTTLNQETKIIASVAQTYFEMDQQLSSQASELSDGGGSVDTPIYEIGNVAMSKLTEEMKSEELVAASTTIVDYKIIWRDSTK